MALPLLAWLIPTIIAGTTAASAAGSNIGAAANSGGIDNGSYKTFYNWFAKSSNQEIGQAFKEYAKSQGISNEFLDSMDAQQLGQMLRDSPYFDQSTTFLGAGNDTINFDNALQDLEEMLSVKAPTPIDYGQIYQQAADALAKENAEVEALYDQALNLQTTNLNQQMADLNKSYKDTTNQILSSDYIKNRQLMDAATSELSRSRRNALEAGASAGLRLANNVNTMLSVQNRQAQQSLETSNNLAQMMLNQRQAAAGIRGDYYNAITNNMNQKASLKKGNTERLEGLKGQYASNAQLDYNNKLDTWDNAWKDNAWANPYRNQQSQQALKNKYGG